MIVKLENVGVIKSCEVEFVQGLNIVAGQSGSGKSTLMRCIKNVATNDFSDSDISFGKNTMSITIQNNGHTVSYTRSRKSSNDKCSYTVDGEQYVKIGRQSLPAVENVLKVGDVEINGDKVNFNFNLQFSTPFLILGSQSTLYSVLTYRNTFDISSINDKYAADVKCNLNEINANLKVRDKLNDSLNVLCEQETALKDVELLYSKFITYKHRLNLLNDIQSIKSLLTTSKSYDDRIRKYESILKDIDAVLVHNEALINLTSCNSKFRFIQNINSKVEIYNNIICKCDNAICLCKQLHDLKTLTNNYVILSDVINNIVSLNNIVDCDVLKYENLIMSLNDIINTLLLHKRLCDTSYIFKYINDKTKLECIKDLIILFNKINELSTLNENETNLDSYITNISNKLNEFDVCPLCGCKISNHC